MISSRPDVTLTMGVEEEFLILDPATGQTVPYADAIIARQREDGDQLPAGVSIQRELRATQLEAATGVCTTSVELYGHLVAARRSLAKAAVAEGWVVAATAAPPAGASEHAAPPNHSRLLEIDGIYQGMVSDYEACGCHVHVGVPDRDTGVAVLNHLAPWLPTLLALSVNSPFDRGRDTGYGSWRIVLQSRFPGFGTPPHFTSYADYQRCVDTLVDCGVLVDNNQSFWLARPSGRYPTVELRVADTALTVDGALLQALLGRALINTALCALDRGREAVPVHPQIAAAAVWSAARYGPTGQAIDVATGSTVAAKTMVTRLVDLCRDALDATGDLTTVHTLLDQLRQTGTGADRQRAVVGAGPAALHRMLHERTLEFGDRKE